MRFDASYAPASFAPRRGTGRPLVATAETGERPVRGLLIGLAISAGLWAAILAAVF